MQYDVEDKEPLSMEEFLILMVVCFFLCLFGYIIGRIILTLFGG